MAKEVVSPAQQKRMAIFAEMTPDLQKVATACEKKLATEARGLIIIRYQLAGQIKDIVGDETKYGSNAVKQLGDYLGIDPTILYQLRSLATTFTLKQIEKLAERTMENGRKINDKHLMVLTMVEKTEERNKLIERVFDESLSANELGRIVEAEHTKKHSQKRGHRKPARPTSPQAAAADIEKSLQFVNNRYTNWEETLFDEVDKIGIDRVDAPLMSRLQSALAQAQSAEEHVISTKKRLEKNVERVEKLLEAQKKAEADKAKEEKAAKKEASKEHKVSRRPAAAAATA